MRSYDLARTPLETRVEYEQRQSTNRITVAHRELQLDQPSIRT